jgi:hypothetical protein
MHLELRLHCCFILQKLAALDIRLLSELLVLRQLGRVKPQLAILTSRSRGIQLGLSPA